ncbi:ATP-binding protein [Luteibacter aegosomatis]|uniref:ATP-binding protein n=1 Tax=Luteibacter aegosomatis TaxID=2911537 RepID=UPI001FFA2A4E|nr:ATP-binding protein [Luteibacter aegosomatis]UPG87864.1 ATP-binding protein [Luteibacter aegosomatis]
MRVGEVVAVAGTKISLRIDDESSKEVLFHRGQRLKGISIREYLAISRGFRDIICVVEGEHLDERRSETDGVRTGFVRRVDARPIGYFEDGRFHNGIKFLPMILDEAHLLSDDRIAQIFDRAGHAPGLRIGVLQKEGLPVALPYTRMFNSHIGIFGNTGSGKSNTLAKLYTSLFERNPPGLADRSRFLVVDFNGEYTQQQLVQAPRKRVLDVSTGHQAGDRITIAPDEFWDVETLSLLFQATQHTQRPFLNRVIEGRKRFGQKPDSLTHYFQKVLKRTFTSARPRAELLDRARFLANQLNLTALVTALEHIQWYNTATGAFKDTHTDTWFNSDGAGYAGSLEPVVEATAMPNVDAFDELSIRCQLGLMNDIGTGQVQLDHILPLMKRMEGAITMLRKAVEVGLEAPVQQPMVTVVSLKRCNTDAKKILPILVAKHAYQQHRASVASPPDRTLHLIIDEAHNILSEMSTREAEAWKDYRLELFEEIIKEGRKFGVFLTIASQRPADISPTIVSQVHNFLIHRLVNDRDLFLIDNTLSTLDPISRALIPNLIQGCCVVTGTAFDLPMVVQIDILTAAQRPDSGDIDLEALWEL